MSQAIIQAARAQALAGIFAAYSAGRKLTPWSPGFHLPKVSTCCFEGAER